ncbi:hypothetical protein QUB47_21605 [Microcoleus sp. AT9_B5]
MFGDWGAGFASGVSNGFLAERLYYSDFGNRIKQSQSNIQKISGAEILDNVHKLFNDASLNVKVKHI